MIWRDRGRGFRVSAALLTMLAALSACKRAAETKSLTFQQIYAEDTIPSRHGERVRTTGMVLYSDPLWRLLVVQDSNQGIYIDPPPQLELQPGDQLEITGVTADPGKFLEQTE